MVLVSIVVSIPACHAGDRGSIPRRGEMIFFSTQLATHFSASPQRRSLNALSRRKCLLRFAGHGEIHLMATPLNTSFVTAFCPKSNSSEDMDALSHHPICSGLDENSSSKSIPFFPQAGTCLWCWRFLLIPHGSLVPTKPHIPSHLPSSSCVASKSLAKIS